MYRNLSKYLRNQFKKDEEKTYNITRYKNLL